MERRFYDIIFSHATFQAEYQLSVGLLRKEIGTQKIHFTKRLSPLYVTPSFGLFRSSYSLEAWSYRISMCERMKLVTGEFENDGMNSLKALSTPPSRNP